jgi:hypothetical protein
MTADGEISGVASPAPLPAPDDGDEKPKTRRRPRRRTTQGTADAALLVNAIAILSRHLGRQWNKHDSAQLRDAVGAPFPRPVGGRRAINLPQHEDDDGQPDTRILREAVATAVLEQNALGPPGRRISARVLAAASVICGDRVPLRPHDIRAGGVPPGELLDRIASGLHPHLKREEKLAAETVETER